MIDTIIDSLKGQALGGLTEKFGVDASQADGIFDVVKDTVSGTVQKEGSSGVGGLLNLFSSEDNNAEGNGMLNNLSGNLTSNLTDKLGFDGAKASGIAAFIIPMITKLFSDKIGGDKGNLLSMLGDGGGIGDMVKGAAGDFVKGKLGGLFGK